MIKSRKQSVYYAIIGASAVLYSVLNFQYHTGIINDDAVYLMGARQLVHAPLFQSLVLRPDYPLPGLPVLLAPFAMMIAPHWISLEWLSVLCAIACVFLLGTWAKQFSSSSGEVLTVVALFAFNPAVVQFSGILMPTLFYTGVVIASYLLMGSLLKTPTIPKALGLGFLLGWGSLLRPEGILLLISVLGILVWTRKGRLFIHYTLLPIVLWALFFVYGWIPKIGSHTEYGGDLNALTMFWSHHLLSGISFIRHMSYDFLVKSFAFFPKALKACSSLLGSSTLILMSLTMMGIGFRNLWIYRTYPRPLLISAGLFCGIYFLTHVFWHVREPRYVVPLLPFILILVVRGFNQILAPFNQRKWIQQLMVVVLLLSYGYKNGNAVYETIWSRDPMKSPPWRSLAWIREQTPPGIKVMSNIAPNIELYTDRPALSGMNSNNYELLMYEIMKQHLDYVVYRELTFLTPNVEGTDNNNAAWERVRSWISHHPEQFTLVFSDPLEKTSIYRIESESGFSVAYPKFTEAAQKYEAGLWDDSLHLARESWAMDPGLGSVANLLGALYMKKNDLKQAEYYFLKTIELLPLTWKARLNLATLYHMEGKEDKSNDFAQQALDIAARRGNQIQMLLRIETLHGMWQNHSAFIFIDLPSQVVEAP